MIRLARFLRKLRIDRSERLFDMAQKLNVSSAYLSAVENGKRVAPNSWFETIVRLYDLDSAQQRELREGIDESAKQVRIDIEDASSNKRDCALMFARKFEDISDEDIAEIMNLLRRRVE